MGNRREKKGNRGKERKMEEEKRIRRGRNRNRIYRIYNTSLCEINRELKNRETEIRNGNGDRETETERQKQR